MTTNSLSRRHLAPPPHNLLISSDYKDYYENITKNILPYRRKSVYLQIERNTPPTISVWFSVLCHNRRIIYNAPEKVKSSDDQRTT